MRISKTTHNALQILIATARSGSTLIKGAAVAQELDLTQQNTSKIVHLLSRGGFIKAVRGPQGGMMLALRPEDIRIGDVVLAMERVAMDDERASGDSVGFAGLFDDALEAFVAVLNQHTLADMVRSRKGSPLSVFNAGSRPKSKRPRSKAATIAHDVRSETAKSTKTRPVSK
jgi:Rrf2 family nitric oxide-sensitive transcriptional repressor